MNIIYWLQQYSYKVINCVMEHQAVVEIKQQYDECIKKVNSLTEHIKMLSQDNQLQNLEEIVVPEQYLTLLANSLYAINSLAYTYANLKNVNLPQQFNKVQQYYNKAKNPLAVPANSQPPVVVNKQAAKRIIQRGIK